MSCPLPSTGIGERITMAHGGGGSHMQALLEGLFLPAFSNPQLDRRHDGAVLDVAGARIALTTDAYVVRPLQFPGADIGSLAVNGTVNDLAMCGAQPLALSAAFVLDQGLELAVLQQVVASMRAAADAIGVPIVTGDTKVVEAGAEPGLTITTAGVGRVAANVDVAPQNIRPGDALLLSGDIARHGMAVMAARDDLAFEPPLRSDCAPLVDAVMALFAAGVEVRCLRDCTRGGLAASVIELASASGHSLHVDETALAVADEVRGACELLGIDPLHVANEGRFLAVVAATDVERALVALRAVPVAAGAVCIGRVHAGASRAVVDTAIGSQRRLHLLSTDQLPRIC
ncbi:MAG: hydrogenase expression/formation protein HypE [Planctomycetota bacterium]|jgi:hydrogenase expression/formation protein HypE